MPAIDSARTKSPMPQLGGSMFSKKASPFQLQYASAHSGEITVRGSDGATEAATTTG